MDYTKSDAYVVHPATGNRMHQDDQPVTTLVSPEDMNRVMWSLMEVVKSGGQVPADFDPDDPSTYSVLVKAIFAIRGFVSTRDFGLLGNATDESVGMLLAAASGVPVMLEPGKEFVCGQLTVPTNGILNFWSPGVGARLSCKNGVNDHFIRNVSKATTYLEGIHLDGNRANNNRLPNYPGVVFVQKGTLIMRRCTVTNAPSYGVLAGNVDYAFNSADFVDLVDLQDVQVDCGNSAVGADDCYRIFRTKKVRLTNCESVGGLSGARIGYYVDDAEVRGGIYRDSYADVGVTLFFVGKGRVQGITASGHFQHGIEVDASNNVVVSGNVVTDNAKNGIYLTEYGPPAVGAQYAGTYDGVTTTYPNLYPCRGVVVQNNVVRRNGKAGIRAIGQGNGVSIKDNHIEGNNTINDSFENCGLAIDGGNLNSDGICIGGNTFVNTGNQQRSVSQSNVHYLTTSEGNSHSNGQQFQFPIRGHRTNYCVGAIFQTAQIVSAYKGALVPDAAASTGSVRQITDASASSSVVWTVEVPVPPAGSKAVVISLDTPDTMTAVQLDVDVYDGTTFKASAYSNPLTLTGAYNETVAVVSAALASNNYDRLRVSVTTNAALVGKVNIESLAVYGVTEQ